MIRLLFDQARLDQSGFRKTRLFQDLRAKPAGLADIGARWGVSEIFHVAGVRHDHMSNENKLLSEALRPQRLGDLTLPKRDIDRLKQMVRSGTIMNMIFYGHSGLGKTSTARVIIAELVANADAHAYEFNGSSGNSATDVRKIQDYAVSGSLNFGPKICFIDEADFLSPQAQANLRYIIEKSSKQCRFLFTAKNANKFSEALRSRMRMICFDIAPSDRAEVMECLIGCAQHRGTDP